MNGERERDSMCQCILLLEKESVGVFYIGARDRQTETATERECVCVCVCFISEREKVKRAFISSGFLTQRNFRKVLMESKISEDVTSSASHLLQLFTKHKT